MSPKLVKVIKVLIILIVGHHCQYSRPGYGDDREFTLPGNQGEQNRMDLLTVVMHELGHLLGYDHDAEGVMAETLAAGVRRVELEHDHGMATDQVFAQAGEHRSEARPGTWVNERPASNWPWAKRRRDLTVAAEWILPELLIP